MFLSIATEVVAALNVSKVYGQLRAVDDTSLTVQTGEIVGILGPNGAGKTTLLEMIVGLRTPTSGTIRALGLDPYRDRRRIVHFLGVQPQEANLFPLLRVAETLKLFASFHKQPLALEQVLDMVDLQDKKDDLVWRLSGGQRQRLLLGVTLIANPQLLFLDEPTGSLDPQARRHLWAVIQEQRHMGRTVLLTTHYMEEAQSLCDRVAIMDRGKLLAMDTPQNLIQQHFPGQTVVFAAAGALDLGRWKTFPGVSDAIVRSSGHSQEIRLHSRQPDQTLRALFAEPGLPAPQDVRIEQATLEDVFLELTGRPIGGAGSRKGGARKRAM